MSTTSIEGVLPIAAGIGVLVIATAESPHADIRAAPAATNTKAAEAIGLDVIFVRPPSRGNAQPRLAIRDLEIVLPNGLERNTLSRAEALSRH